VAVVGIGATQLDLRPILGSSRTTDLSLALIACISVALRRRWPMPSLAAATVAVTVLASFGQVVFPLAVMLSLVGYTVATASPRRASIAALVAAEAVLCLGLWIGIAVGHGAHGSVAAEAIESLLPLVAVWFVGDSVAARRTYIGGLAEQAEQKRITETERARQAVREERIQIARELHDVVAHSLAVITVQAGVGRRLMGKQPEQASTALESIEATGRTAQDELRLVLGLLRDDDGEQAQLVPAPGLEDLDELAETVRAAGSPVALHTSGTGRHLSPALELSAYRIIQEALTNVVKHAPGAGATVDVAVVDRELVIEVLDDGDAGASAWHRWHARARRRLRRRARCGGGTRAGLPSPGGHPPSGRTVTIRVLVVDDQELLRTAFGALIDAEDDMEVVGEAAEGAEAVRLAASLSPDVVVMDVRMPTMDGIEATRRITSSEAATVPRVLILTTFDLDEYVFAAMRAGASGFVLKSRPLDELLSAIRVVADGEALLAPSVTRRLIAHFAGQARSPDKRRSDLDFLTEREREVLLLLARGLSNAELADSLHVSIPTAKTHVSRILNKLGARDRAQLVVIAYESGLVDTG
jgi:DNA-binding NarL/FixJ family response regulator/signal transduction histidine kinase